MPSDRELRAAVARVVHARLADAVDPDGAPAGSTHWQDLLQELSLAFPGEVVAREAKDLYGRCASRDPAAVGELLDSYVRGV